MVCITEFRAALRPACIALLCAGFFAGLFILSLPKAVFELGKNPALRIGLTFTGGLYGYEHLLSTGLGSIKTIKESGVYTKEEAVRLLESGGLDAFIEIPEGTFDALTHRGRRAPVYLHASDPVIGTLCANTLNQTVNAVNRLKSIIFVYEDAFFQGDTNTEEFIMKENKLLMSLMSQMLFRETGLETFDAMPQYKAAIYTLGICLLSFCFAICFALSLTNELHIGRLRRFKARGYKTGTVMLLKAAVFTAAVAILSAYVFLALSKLGYVKKPFLFTAVTVCLSLCLYILFVMAAFAIREFDRVFLACFAFALFLMFAGGGFYPEYTDASILRGLNPVWWVRLFVEQGFT